MSAEEHYLNLPSLSSVPSDRLVDLARTLEDRSEGSLYVRIRDELDRRGMRIEPATSEQILARLRWVAARLTAGSLRFWDLDQLRSETGLVFEDERISVWLVEDAEDRDDVHSSDRWLRGFSGDRFEEIPFVGRIRCVDPRTEIVNETGDGLVEVDLRTLSAERLRALRTEAGEAGDLDLVATLDQLEEKSR